MLLELIRPISLTHSQFVCAIMASHMPPATGAGASAPRKVEEITQMAQNYDYNPSIPLRYWLRTAATLLREVSLMPSASSNLRELTNSFLYRLVYTNERGTMNKRTSFYFAMLSWCW